MFSSRNIHFAILGIILGASAGYIFAFYQVQGAEPVPLTANSQPGAVPNGHPEVDDGQMLEMLKKAVEADPTKPEMLNRYALVLYQAGRLQEAEQWFGKALALDPNNIDMRSMHGAVLWRLGKKQEAEAELQMTLKQEPNHVPSLHGLLLLAVEKHDLPGAERLLQQIEKIEPGYEGLSDLKSRIEAERQTAK